MTSWIDRLRIALILSPALFLLHVWLIAMSSSPLLQSVGLWKLLGMAAVAAIVEAYSFVLAVSAVRDMARKDGR